MWLFIRISALWLRFLFNNEFKINLLSIAIPTSHYLTTRFVSLSLNPHEKLRRKCVGIFYNLYLRIISWKMSHCRFFIMQSRIINVTRGNVQMLHSLFIIHIICFLLFPDDYWWPLHSARSKMTDAIIYLSKANGGERCFYLQNISLADELHQLVVFPE